MQNSLWGIEKIYTNQTDKITKKATNPQVSGYYYTISDTKQYYIKRRVAINNTNHLCNHNISIACLRIS